MPITFTVDPAARIVRVAMDGDLSREAIEQYRSVLEGDPAYSPELPRLIDARRVSGPPATSVIHRLAEASRYGGGGPFGPRAIVADRDAVYGMFRMLEILSEDGCVRFRVFRTVEAAEAWLGQALGCPEPEIGA